MGICYFFLCMPSIKLAGLLGPIFAGCVPLASQTPTPLQSTQRPIIIDPILITFFGQMYFTLRIHMCFSNFQRFLLFSTLKSRKCVKPHSSTSFKKCNPPQKQSSHENATPSSNPSLGSTFPGLQNTSYIHSTRVTMYIRSDNNTLPCRVASS